LNNFNDVLKFSSTLQHEFDDNNSGDFRIRNSNGKESDEEEVLTGKVSIRTYWKYLRAGDSIVMLIILAIGFLALATLSSFSDYWLAKW